MADSRGLSDEMETPVVVEVDDTLNAHIDRIRTDQGNQTLYRQLVALKNEFDQLKHEFENTKIPNFFRVKLKDAMKIQDCTNATVKLLDTLEAYEVSLFKQPAYSDLAKTNLMDALAEFDNTIKTLPSNAKMKKIGLVMAGIGALVAATSTILLVLSAIASSTGVLTPMGLVGAALSTAGLVSGAGLTGFGMYKFFKEDHTTGLERLKSVRVAAANRMSFSEKAVASFAKMMTN